LVHNLWRSSIAKLRLSHAKLAGRNPRINPLTGALGRARQVQRVTDMVAEQHQWAKVFTAAQIALRPACIIPPR